MAKSANIVAMARAVIANASANSGAPSLITAGGTGDGVKVNGATIDRLTNRAESLKLAVAGLAALADTKTLSIAVEIQESADASTWDTAVAVEAATVVATGDGGSNETFCREYDIDLSARKQYVRFNVTPDLSATGTDTAEFIGVAFLAGSDRDPSSGSVV